MADILIKNMEMPKTERERFGKCDECGKVIFKGDMVIHTDWAEYFCCKECWSKRKKDVDEENGKNVFIIARWERTE